MRYFTIEQRESLREALTTRAAMLRERVSRPHRHSSRFSHAEGSRFIDQGPSGKTLSADRDKPADTDRLELCRIEETLVKLRSPDFGICVECEGDIAYVLLRDNPFTTLCRQCQQRKDLAPFVPNEI